MTMQFADGSVRNFLWNDVRLSNAAPERSLTLPPARVN